jgi:hypothetical protein
LHFIIIRISLKTLYKPAFYKIVGTFFILFSLANFSLQAQVASQQKYNYYNVTWVQYFSNIKLSEKIFCNSDIAYRSKDFIDNPYLFSVRSGCGYQLNNRQSILLGYAYFNNGNLANAQVRWRAENRIFQQYQYNVTTKHIKYFHRLRLEERWREQPPTYHFSDFSVRLRYQINIQISLWEDKPYTNYPYLILSNEIFFQVGKSVVYNYFDQNRALIGVGYGLSKNLQLQAHYIFFVTQKSDGYHYDISNYARLALTQAIDLRKKKSEVKI